MVNFSEVFVYSEHPTTCPKCGNPTKIILDLDHTTNQTQVCKCLSFTCQYEFVVQNDFESVEA